MFWFYASARKIEIKKSDILVSDSINVYPCKFQFSNDWNGLTKTAVFRAGTSAIEVLLDENCECEIPWEVLLKDKLDLFVGCYGTKGEDIILNTTWTNIGKIYEGTKNKAVPGEEPTPDIFTQIFSQMGDLSSLDTEDKSSLVNAINEVNAKTSEVETNLDTKVDISGGTVTGPIMFSEENVAMAYTFEDEPVEDDSTPQGTVVSSDGLTKNSVEPLCIHASSGLVDFDNGESPSILMGVVGDEDMPYSVPNMQQMKESIPTKTSQLQNDSGFITKDDIPNIPVNPDNPSTPVNVPTKVSQLENDTGYITEADIPPIPTKTSELTNDSGFVTEQYVDNAISGIEGGEGIVGPPGENGQDGKDGENGVTFTPSVSADGVLTWTNDGGLENPNPVDIMGPEGPKGEPGQNGQDGFSPTVSTSINEEKNGVDVTITDVNGDHTFTILNGIDGGSGTGGTGGDSTPIGTVISFLGKTAPKDYLICDGTTYNISDYPKLSKFFENQFGAKNYFGGDGTTTFAVPDMRNLFLRGYHGDAGDQLSGEIGERQEATKIPQVYAGTLGVSMRSPKDEYSYPLNTEMQERTSGGSRYSSGGAWVSDSMDVVYRYATRPVNMTVLYCIKAAESLPAENAYSAEEQTIGRWINGKPLYRIVLEAMSPSAVNTEQSIYDISSLNIDSVVSLDGIVNNTPINWYKDSTHYFATRFVGATGIQMMVGHSTYTNIPVHITIAYTKTTDHDTV